MGKHNYPWSDYTVGGRRAPDLIPVIPYNSLSSDSVDDAPFGVAESPNATSLHPYHPIDDLVAHGDADIDLLLQDPFYIVSRLLSSASRSWSQLLNYIDGDIQVCSAAEEEQLSAALEQFRFNFGLLIRIKGFLAEDLLVIEEKGSVSWPKATDPALRARIDGIQASLAKDYGFLIIRSGQLASRCETGIGVLVSVAQLQEAQKGINQTKQVHDLTKLAFFFIPLTFVSSIYGMNVSLFKDYPPIWTYFATAVPLTAVVWFVSGMYGRQSLIRRVPKRLAWSHIRRKCFGDNIETGS